MHHARSIIRVVASIQSCDDMLGQLRERLSRFNPVVGPMLPQQAGVLVALTREATPHLLLTRRSPHLSRHGGQVAFPGGRFEQGDSDLAQTALREAREEVGLHPRLVEVIGTLSTVVSRHSISVQPVVGLIPADFTETPDDYEIEAVFRVSLDWLLQTPPARIDHFPEQVSAPCWYYQDYEIWGMSAMVIQELLETAFDWTHDLHA